MTMLETAEIVAERYGVSREAQDEYALQIAAAHRRRAGSRAASTPRSCRCHGHGGAGQGDRRDQRTSRSRWSKDEGNRADTTLEGLPR